MNDCSQSKIFTSEYKCQGLFSTIFIFTNTYGAQALQFISQFCMKAFESIAVNFQKLKIVPLRFFRSLQQVFLCNSYGLDFHKYIFPKTKDRKLTQIIITRYALVQFHICFRHVAYIFITFAKQALYNLYIKINLYYHQSIFKLSVALWCSVISQKVKMFC